MQTTHLALPLIDAAQAQKHVTHNEALALIDALAHLAVTTRNVVSPPASPSEGDRILVGASATGAFSGKDGQIATFLAGAWTFLTPQPGWRCYVATESLSLLYNGTDWVDLGASLRELQNLYKLGVGTTADATNPLAAKLNAALFAAKSVAEGGNGDLRFKLNKESAARTVSQLYQTNWSGRAETGLTGDDNFHLKVSADGASWKEAIVVDSATGGVAFPSGGPTKIIAFSSSGTYAPSPGMKFVELILFGGGGGGGSGAVNAAGAAASGGAGGGASGIAYGQFTAAQIGASQTVTIGAGGTGGAAISTNATAGNAGGAGGATSVGTLLKVFGGGGGAGGGLAVASGGGGGGCAFATATSGSGATAGVSSFGVANGGAGAGAANVSAIYFGSGGGGAPATGGPGTAGGICYLGASGGGSGGGLTTGNATSAGGGGGQQVVGGVLFLAAGGAAGAAGGTGSTFVASGNLRQAGGGGGGGGSSLTTAGMGGAGGLGGGGGGGGGAAQNGGTSGRGGDGGAGYAVIIEHF
ncbi:MAG TPA: DUF2793 domain-containing protein [Methylocystis sp.]